MTDDPAFGILTSRGDVDRIVEKAVAAERGGFDFFGVGDTQSIFRELYVTLGAVAANTDRIEVGPAVTNPVTRHPAVTASALCTLDDASDGRAVLGLGSGDSAVRTLGNSPATIDEMERFVEQFRALTAGEEATVDDHPVALTWVRDGDDQFDVPVVLSAAGPRTQKLAGRVADRVLLASGITADVVETAAARVTEGAREAGRDPDDVEVWVWVKTNFGETREDAVAAMYTQLASTANHVFRYGMDAKGVPPEYRDRVRGLQEAYQPQRHLGLEASNPNSELVERFDLAEFLADRFTAAGPPEQVTETLRDVAGIDAVDGLFFTADTTDQLGHLRRMADEVLPEIAAQG